MEESGENWPSESYLEEGDDVNDLSFDGEEFVDDDEEKGDSFCESKIDRKQKQRELTESLLALSATIPAFKKMDKTSILDNASKYVKQLQQRVRELEQEVQSNIICNDKGSTSSCEVNSNDYYCGPNEILPEVKVRVLHKDVLIIIHCEKQKGTMLKILSHLENIHLSIVNSSVLRFGKSTLDITITAKMGDGYNMGVDELMDKTSILDNASKYLKQLQQRVRELEQEVQSNIICNDKGSTSSCEVNSNDYYCGPNEILPEVKVRVLHKDVLIIIHCQKQKGTMLKILSHLENIHPSIVNSSVLRFGKSTLDITITAQMGNGYNMGVDELVKTLRVAILTQ